MPTNYPAAFKTLLDPVLTSGKTISLDRLFSHPSLGTVKRATKLQHLKKFISQHVQYVGVVEGVLPDDASLIKAIEGKLGAKITEQNVVDANGHCAHIVLSAARPVLETFVKESLAAHLSGTTLNVTLTDLIDFLLNEYGSFSRGAGNSLISTAGRMNERLLMSCLQAAGMVEDTDFTRTGTRSEGDIVIHCHAGSKIPLGVEVKSHHARERLQRGLTDVSEPKVGAGYFVNSGEFGAGRTRSLIQTKTAAVYMPARTLAQVDQVARDMTVHDKIAAGSRFYRPLEQFATDMAVYSRTGRLPKF